jgi:cellulose synthase/poly-beta-1,6-N-acetylglucosamine synthase-like glycosyltransferase
VWENKSGYPALYNRGLKEAKYDWVAFLDDDCVASSHWIRQMGKSIRHQKDFAAILGHTKPYCPQNIYSLATHIFNSEWKENNSLGEHIFNLEILDNKNIVYNKRFLQKNHVRYDETRTVYLGGAAEDCDLGMQIQQHGGAAVYNSSMLAFHKEPKGFLAYWNKYIRSLASYEWYKEKWKNKRHPATKNRVHFRLLALRIARSYNYAGLKLILLFILLYTTVMISMTLLFLTIIPGVRMRFIRWVDQCLNR